MTYNANQFLGAPAILDLATHVGKSIAMARAKGDAQRLDTLNRIYSNMTPEAKGRADVFAAWRVVEG
jgi:hypothetical protein